MGEDGCDENPNPSLFHVLKAENKVILNRDRVMSTKVPTVHAHTNAQ